ncbi:hypothetical protein VC83_02552 [Pseudogymnoascus destructans]|uniref:HAT C-terminal dimerisation domain-containing protein n=1 Tax=Pseudogymnoascus destructans TaxID=655981 RepID=A0A177AG63_9PEZI|nr:uncharacterized protein VC83_02552 [Pseudogymnoascus destructans]OAF61095.1 hypothetical protein VC83_02552 [Pseudogymnoascus destructans]
MQQLDISMQDIALTTEDWAIIKDLEQLIVFKKIYPDSIDDIRRSRARAQFEDVCRKYKTRQYHLDTERIEHETALSFALGNANNREQEPDSDEDLFASEGISFEEPEWKRWMLEPRPGEHTDIFKYWSSKQYQYPIVAQVARDHLAISATSAPSERVFSNGSDIYHKETKQVITINN